MEEKKHKIVVTLLAVSSIAVILRFPPTRPLSISEVARVFRWVCAADTIVFFVFTQLLWRLALVRAVLGLGPYLGGRWEGTLITNWPTAIEVRPELPLRLDVRHTFHTLRCTHITKNSVNTAYAADIIEEDGEYYLVYVYSSRPVDIEDVERTRPHDGACRLRILNQDPRMMEGLYWTNKIVEKTFSTNGSIQLTYISR